MSTVRAGRYEVAMTLRQGALWWVAAPLIAAVAVLLALDPGDELDRFGVAGAVGGAGVPLATLAALLGGLVGAGVVRTRAAGGRAELDRTLPTGATSRLVVLIGGVALVLAALVGVGQVAVSVVLAVRAADPLAVAWGLFATVALVLPATLTGVAVGAALGAAVRPLPARLLVVVLWCWTSMMPSQTWRFVSGWGAGTPTGTILSPAGDQVAVAWMGARPFYALRDGDGSWLRPALDDGAALEHLLAAAAVVVLAVLLARLATGVRAAVRAG